MVYVNVWLLFLRTIFSYILFPENNDKYYLSGKKLFSLSFRYAEKDKKSFLFFVKSYFHVLLSGKLALQNVSHLYASGNVFLYNNDSAPASEKARVAHAEYFLKKPINGSIWKDKLLGYFSFTDKLFQCVLVTLLFIILFPIALFAKYRSSIGLILREYIELVNLLKVIDRYKVKTLYYYSIYEKDSNISSIALQRAGVKVMKITSLTPLKFWNSIIVAADGLMLCDANQYDELDTFKETIQVKTIEIWGPERIAEVADHYLKLDKNSNNKNTIGYYSSASYLRALQGDIEQNNMKKNEDTVKTYLVEYLKGHPAIKLIIFPHPREKKDMNRKIAMEHYSGFFDGLNYSIYDSTGPSSSCFEQVDVGIAMYSSSIYERLYFGYKSIMMPFGEQGFVLPGKAISAICATDKTDLFNKIDAFTGLSVQEYFRVTGLKKSPFMLFEERK